MQYEPKKEVGRTVDDIIYLYCLHYYMLCYFAAGVHLTATNLTRQSYIADSAPGVATQTCRDTHRHAYHNTSLSYRGWITSGQRILTKGTPPLKTLPFLCDSCPSWLLGSRVVSVLDSGTEGPGSNRSCDAVG